ncbi:MAG: glycerophosphodiester phosphodiesterase [Propioniciclava sp.]|nr:glycerophosphodiester phosphodiesterase [Propioniciclava sp.]
MTSVWAHRGASGYAPENTLPAFELALEQGADGFELDVQLTRDDEVVVIHDETLERTTDGNGWVADHSLEDLRKLDASYGHEKYGGTRIPTLAEVFDLVRDTGTMVNVELKNSRIAYKGLEERVLAIVEAHGMAHRVVLSSFNHYSLRHLVGLGSALPLGALYSEPLWKPWQYAARLGATALHPSLAATRRKIVEKSHEHDLAVHVWTVNEPEDVQRMVGLGVDALITNYPDVARSLVG